MHGCNPMGTDRIRYFRYVSGKWRWRPEKEMRALGFHLVNMGRGGPEIDTKGRPVPSPDDTARAVALNQEWDKVRTGVVPAPGEVFPRGSVGEGYQRAMKMRAAERQKKGIVWTKEQHSRDDWPRAWRWLKPVFGDCDPKTIEPEMFLSVDEKTGELKGLMAKVELRVSDGERHRVIKVWRALWKRMAAMKYCTLEADPSMAFANSTPDPRQERWEHHEVLRHVQRAWRIGLKGLAACLAVAWDSMLSPVDARTLTLGQMTRDRGGPLFFLDRAKTGRAAAGTLTQWSEAILAAYLKSLPYELHDDAPIFRTAGSEPGPKGGRRWQPVPYSKNKLSKDFRVARSSIDPDDERQIADMRRSGAVEADAGGTTDADLSNKMANTINASSRLRKTYTPVNVVSVRRVDEARERGRKELREQKPDRSVMKGNGEVS